MSELFYLNTPIYNKLKSLKVAKSKAKGGVGDGSLAGGGVSDGGMNVCVCDDVYDDVSDIVCEGVYDSVCDVACDSV